MTKRKLKILLILTISAIILLNFNCSDDDDSSDTNPNPSGNEVTGVQNLEINIKGAEKLANIDFSTGEIGTEVNTPSTWDISFYHPETSDVAISSNNNVTAINLGNSKGFNDVKEVSGSDFKQLKGDKGWHSGKKGKQFNMTKAIYIFKTSENKYVKFEVLSTVSGIIKFRYFYQKDSSTNLETS